MNFILLVTADSKCLNSPKFFDFYWSNLYLYYELHLYFSRRVHYLLGVGFEPSAYYKEYYDYFK